MCVAAIIHKPVSLLFLKNMESSNPHGGGVGWATPEGVAFKKGLNAVQIHAMQEARQLTYPYLLHFRWATLGAISEELCHPFPLGIRALLPEVEGVADAVLIHNGTWTPKVPWNERFMLPSALFGPVSDTAIAAYVAATRESVLDTVAWANAVGRVVDGKLKVTKRGSTWTEHDGNEYSNLSWLPYSHRSGFRYTHTERDYGTPWYDRRAERGEGRSYVYTAPAQRDYRVRTKDAKIYTWEEWLDLRYPPVDEIAEQNEFPWEERIKDTACESCGLFLCKCIPPHRPNLAKLAEEDPEALGAYVEGLLTRIGPDTSDSLDAAVVAALDFMTDEQWQRYILRRYPDEAVTEDAGTVNAYIERIIAEEEAAKRDA